MGLRGGRLAVALPGGDPESDRDSVPPGVFLLPLLCGEAAGSGMYVTAGLAFALAADEFRFWRRNLRMRRFARNHQ